METGLQGQGRRWLFVQLSRHGPQGMLVFAVTVHRSSELKAATPLLTQQARSFCPSGLIHQSEFASFIVSLTKVFHVIAASVHLMHIKGFCGSAQVAFHDRDQLSSSCPRWERCGASKCHIAISDDKR